MKELLTIFTPTYNRADLLPRLYNSLKRQTNKNFIWMIIDDGSTDGTEELVKDWMKLCKEFHIEYYKKENGGLQSGYVEAIKHLETELAMCIDSDDYAVDNAIELIEQKWASCKKSKYGGLMGLDCYDNKEILGGLYPSTMKEVDLIDLCVGKIKRSARDRALVIRSELYKSTVPAKRYKGERTMNATYLHLQIAEQYKFALLNEPLIVVNYQLDGLSKGKKRHYLSAPNTYADWRIYMLSLPNAPFSFYFKNAIHYVSSCIFARRKIFVADCHHKAIVLLAVPFGIGLNLYLRKFR